MDLTEVNTLDAFIFYFVRKLRKMCSSVEYIGIISFLKM